MAVTEFGGKVDIQGSKRVIAALKGNPELEYSLHKLFDILNEVLEDEIEDGEVNDDSEVASLNTDVTLPKLFAPFKDKSRGWTVKKVEQQALLYINILGYGNGGQNTLANSKRHKASKPKWFPASVAFDGPDAYSNPTRALIEKNEDVIESILK